MFLVGDEQLFVGILVMDAADLASPPSVLPMSSLNTPMLPAASSPKIIQTKSLASHGSPLGRPSMQSLLLKEKSTNSSIKTYFKSPSVKRNAASNENLDDLSSPFSKKIPVAILDPTHPPSPNPSPKNSPGSDTSLNSTIVHNHNMSSTDANTFGLETAPPLDSPNIDPQMRNYLQFMLNENRVLNERIWSIQSENSKRLDELEKVVACNNEIHTEGMASVNARLASIENVQTQVKVNFEARLTQVEASCSSSACGDVEIIRRLEDRLEAHERASKQNNIVIRGLSLPLTGLKDHVIKFLNDKFNYSGQVSKVKPLGKMAKNLENTDFVAVTLESFEDKLQILRSKKNLADLGTVYVQADLTEKESKCAYELRNFARNLKPDGKGIRYSYQKVFVHNAWYKWDSKKNAAVKCQSGSKFSAPPASDPSQQNPTPLAKSSKN